MKIKVCSLSILEEFFSNKEIEVEVDEGTDVEGLIETLKGIYGREFYEKIMKDGSLKEFIVILLNGLSIGMKDGLNTPLKDGDRVVFALSLSGG